jgi:hypothetical protein
VRIIKKAVIAAIIAVGLYAAPAAAECRFTLNFLHGSARLSLADSLLLGDLARAYPAGPMRLSAHADDDGSPAANRRVAEARAASVVGRLRRAGLRRDAVVDPFTLADSWDVIPTKGASSPLNRRVELFVGGCDAQNHIEARRLDAPGVSFSESGRVVLTSPRLPGG